jgi:demethylmenaquinone methyltransferase / 2-methoxy-6-polyprenyl-1,4-benzoquinol methylase
MSEVVSRPNSATPQLATPEHTEPQHPINAGPIAASPTATGVDKSGQRVERMFAEIAGRYDFLNHLLSLGIDKYWRWRTVRNVPPTGTAPVLDLCTGTGDLALAYYRAGRGQTPVVGADFCHPMLVIGEEKRRKAGVVDGLSFVVADAQQLPFPADCFQIVSVAFGLRNVNDTGRGLREMIRVCRPGGRVVVLEFSMPRWQPLRSIYGWYFRNILPRIGELLAGNRSGAYNYLPASVAEFSAGEPLAARMRAGGLRDVRLLPLTLGVATLYVGLK